MDPIKLLYNMHSHNTLNNPICCHTFKMIDIDVENIPNNIIQLCFDKYKSSQEGSLYGSVDINPEFWTNIFFSSYLLAKKNNKHVFNVPNGCCNIDTCGIKKFYELLYEFCKNIE